MKALIIQRPIQSQGFYIDEDEELSIMPDHIVGYFICSKDFNTTKAFGLVIILTNGKVFIPTSSRLEAGMLEGRLKTDLNLNSDNYLVFEK